MGFFQNILNDGGLSFKLATKVLPQKGNLVYEYNPFRNYRLTEKKFEYDGSYYTLEELENEEDNIIVTPINNDTIPVKTGIFKEKDYKYLVIYVLTLILIALILIKHMQNKSTKNNN